MPELSVLPFGLFFSCTDLTDSTLQLAAFCGGRLQTEAHQVVISKVDERKDRRYGVAYSIPPGAVKALDDVELERLCRVAVTQFLAHRVFGDCSSTIVPLDMKNSAWDGPVQIVKPTRERSRI